MSNSDFKVFSEFFDGANEIDKIALLIYGMAINLQNGTRNWININ